jgi:hypothetical protein
MINFFLLPLKKNVFRYISIKHSLELQILKIFNNQNEDLISNSEESMDLYEN